MRNGVWRIVVIVSLAVLMFSVVSIAPPVASGSISGMKFNDVNGNGVKDPGEAGIAGWIINLTNQSGGVISIKTNAAGNYIFSNLPDGNYVVSEKIKPGYLQTAPGLSSDGSATIPVLIALGNNIAGQDFGNLKKGLILGGGWLNSGAEFIASGRYFGNDVEATGIVKYNLSIMIESLSVKSSGIDGKMGVLTGLAKVNGLGSHYYEVRMGNGWFNISVPDVPFSSNSTLKNGSIAISDGSSTSTSSSSSQSSTVIISN